MSRVLLVVAIDDWGLGPLAAKEAAAMRLEPLGNVQVLRVKVEALGGKAARALYGWAANPWVWGIEFERISKEEAMQ